MATTTGVTGAPSGDWMYFDTQTGTLQTSNNGGDWQYRQTPTTNVGNTVYDQYGEPVSTGNTLGSNSYAQQQAAAQAAAQNAARDSFNTGRDNVFSGAQNRAGSFVRNQGNNILNFIDSLRSGQQGIDQSRISATQGKQQGTAGILDMVGRGIRSGGTMLANRNATDSSAAGAIARAYGDLGQRNQANVNNQYNQDIQQIDVQQQALGTQRASAKRGFDIDRQNEVDAIVASAQADFAALNDAASEAGILERIQIEQEKENIRSQTLAKLAELDSQVSQVDSVNPLDQEQVRAQANQRYQAGTAGGNQYSYETSQPANFRGAQLGQLPIYSSRRNREV